jgi:anti-sigma regulatory factor (Ser/Thr protein kinase)
LGKLPVEREPLMHALELTLTATVTAPGVAREAVRTLLEERCERAAIDTATLLVTELVTNAVIHGNGAGASLTLDEVTSGVIHVAVCDRSEDLPQRHPDVPAVEQIGGRGLFLIESFATAWGWEPLRVGKRVWFEVDCPARVSGDAAEAEQV